MVFVNDFSAVKEEQQRDSQNLPHNRKEEGSKVEGSKVLGKS